MSEVQTFDEFVSSVWQRPVHLSTGDLDLIHASMGLAGEAGEVLDLVKKHAFTPQRLAAKGKVFDDEIRKEIADVYFYLRRLMAQLGITESDLQSYLRGKLTTRWIKKEHGHE